MGIPGVPPQCPRSSVSLVDTSTVKLPNSGAGTSAFFTGSGSGATAGTAGTEGMPRWEQILIGAIHGILSNWDKYI